MNSSRSLTVHSSSFGQDPTTLAPGRDVVLEVDMAHGQELAHGVGSRDLLSNAERYRVDELALQALNRWRAQCDAAVTVEGICWSYVLELELLTRLLPVVADAIGLERAMQSAEAEELVLADDDPRTEAIAASVAELHGLRLVHGRNARPLGDSASRSGRPSMARRLRNSSFRLLSTKLVAPRWLRHGSIVVASYWPMMPLLDALLDDPVRRPAVILQSLPTGPRRTIRAALQGGFIGGAGPLRRARARRQAEAVLARLGTIEPTVEVQGLLLGSVFHRLAIDVLEPGLAPWIASAAVIRSALTSGRARHVVLPFDEGAGGRLLAILAREAGITSTLVQHGAYFLPGVLLDFTVADQAAVWSESVVLQRLPHPRLHVVGYPLADEPVPAHRVRGDGEPPRVVILPQPWHPSTSVLDSRVWMRHTLAAIEALRAEAPDAELVLRPHPSDPANLVATLQARFPGLRTDSQTPILDLLAEAELCIGATTTAALQPALVGTQMIFLNLTGNEWKWPLGGQTPVPVARSQDELATWIARWRDGLAHGILLDGREALLQGLGADRPGATQTILSLLDHPRENEAGARAEPVLGGH